MTRLYVVLLKLSGLFTGQLSLDGGQTKLHQGLHLLHTTFLTLISAIFFVRSLWKTLKAVTSLSVDRLSISGFMLFGFSLQEFMSVIFLVFWQLNGSINMLNWTCLHKSSPKINHKPLLLLIFGAELCFAVNYMSISIQAFLSHYMDLSSLEIAIKFTSNLTLLYGEFTKAICLAIFVVAIKELSNELDQFNKHLKRLIKAAARSNLGVEEFGKQLQAEFTKHNQLTEKVERVDRMFKMYTLASLWCVLPTGIMTMVLMLRRSTVLGVYYSSIEMLVCCIHLCGVTLVPAAIRSKFLKAGRVLYQRPSVWQRYDLKIYETSLRFMENITYSQIGISFGGLILIDKQMIFKCVSIIVPYAVLCVQGNMGAQVNVTMNF